MKRKVRKKNGEEKDFCIMCYVGQGFIEPGRITDVLK